MKIEYIETDYEEIIKIDGEIYKCHRSLYSGDWIELLRDKLGIEVIKVNKNK